MSTVADLLTQPTPPLLPEDPYRYGFRDDSVLQPDGTYKRQRIALTLADYLHPHEGDHFMEGNWHDIQRGYLRDVFRFRLQPDPNALVLSRTGLYWDDPALGHHAPDIAVIFGVQRPRQQWNAFHVAQEGARPRLIIELVSPLYRNTDVVEKFLQYHQAGVPVYVIFDKERDADPWTIKAYQRNPRRFVPQPLEEDGRFWLEDLNLWLAVDGQNIRCFDGDTLEEIGDYGAVSQRVAEMRELAAAEKARAEAEKAHADDEKTRADSAEARAQQAEAELARLKRMPPGP